MEILAEIFTRWKDDIVGRETYEKNQLITFEGDHIELDEGYTWEIDQYLTEKGLRQVPDGWYFEDFDEAHHIKRIGKKHLFRLKTKGIDIIAYCVITK